MKNVIKLERSKRFKVHNKRKNKQSERFYNRQNLSVGKLIKIGL